MKFQCTANFRATNLYRNLLDFELWEFANLKYFSNCLSRSRLKFVHQNLWHF